MGFRREACVASKNRKRDEHVLAIYRGWMLKADLYGSLVNEFSFLGIDLINSPRNYMNLHLFPYVYENIKADTAKIMVFPEEETVDLEAVKKNFSKFMVKDYVKSVKGTSFPKYFDNTATQEEFDEQMKTFFQYRGDLFTGGICIKEFLDLKFYDEKPNEWRVFYINNEVGTVSRNSLQGNYTPEPPKELLKKYKDLDSQFYTVDYAELEDGSWKIMETGDGGVSGLSEGQDAESFYRALKIGLFQPEAKDITCGDCERLGNDMGCLACSEEDSAYRRGRLCKGFIDKRFRRYGEL